MSQTAARNRPDLTRSARALAAMLALDAVAFLLVVILWPGSVPFMFGGFCLSWLTAVALVCVQDARGEFDRSEDPS